jgi:tetratricopeptide (TPR) repeat protein
MDAGVHGPYDMSWRLADALRRHLYFGRHHNEWFAMAEVSLDAARKDGDELAEAAMRHALGTCLWGMEQHRAGARELTQAIAIRRRIGDRDRLPASLNNRAMIHLELGSLDRAVGDLHDAIEVDRATGSHRSLLLVGLGAVYLESGRFAEARTLLEEALGRYRSRYAEAEIHFHLGVVNLREGLPIPALALLAGARAYWVEVGSRHGETRARTQYTAALSACGRHADALHEGRLALAAARETENNRHEADAHNVLGSAYAGIGDQSRARECFSAARLISERAGYHRGIIDAACGLATACRLSGDHDQAGRHLGMVARISAATGFWVPPGAKGTTAEGG